MQSNILTHHARITKDSNSKTKSEEVFVFVLRKGFFFPSRQISLQYYWSRHVFKKLRKWAKRYGDARFLGEKIVQPPNVFMVKRVKRRNRVGGHVFGSVIDYSMV